MWNGVASEGDTFCWGGRVNRAIRQMCLFVIYIIYVCPEKVAESEFVVS